MGNLMDTPGTSTNSDELHPQKRRSPRVKRSLPVTVAWSRRDGLRIREQGETTDVSREGALLKMKSQISVASEVTLNRPGGSQPPNKAKVKRVSPDSGSQSFGIGVELSDTEQDYWET